MISETLRLLRTINGYTQQDIADKLNVDRSTYSYYELGKIKPGVEALLKISDIYGMSVDEILNFDVEGGFKIVTSKDAEYDGGLKLTFDEKKIIKYYRKLNEDEKDDMLAKIISLARAKQ